MCLPKLFVFSIPPPSYDLILPQNVKEFQTTEFSPFDYILETSGARVEHETEMTQLKER